MINQGIFHIRGEIIHSHFNLNEEKIKFQIYKNEYEEDEYCFRIYDGKGNNWLLCDSLSFVQETYDYFKSQSNGIIMNDLFCYGFKKE